MNNHVKISHDSSVESVKKPTARSRVTNRKQTFLPDVDGRTREARRYRDVYAGLVAHLGGENEITDAERHLAKRAASLVVWCEVEEGKLAAENGDFDIGPYVTGVNALRRILADLGLERRARDVTPTLEQYAAERYGRSEGAR
ncbi:MAG: hypothetical protein OEN23_13875 [Paracoccaceae bacterium]|nr:hypothetical protein [Paracoccaceae bacterium]